MELEQFKCAVCPRKENNSRWIPCSERMPEVGGMSCLATMKNKFGQVRVREVFSGYGFGSLWYCNNSEVDINCWEVIAWMPLPEPYKEQKEG